MSSNALLLVVVTIAIAVLATPGLALRCYNCTSQNNEQCADPLNATWHLQTHHIKNCEETNYRTPYHSNEKMACRKLVKKEGGGGQTVIRQCWRLSADEPTDGPCNSNSISSYEQSSLVSCHFCSSDLCNGATTSAESVRTLCAAALAAVVFRFFRTQIAAVQ